MSYRRYRVTPGHDELCDCTLCEQNFARLSHEPRAMLPLSPRGETPEQILERLAARLNCEPRQVADRVLRMLEERKRETNQNS